MGAAIVQRLLGLGHEVTVWNRTAQKTAPLVQAGAHLARTPAQLAARSEFVLTMLTDAEALDHVFRAADGLLAADIHAKLFIEMSTVRPACEQALAAAAARKGAAFIDCPVGGTVGPAREGKLLGLVGGNDTDVARARPLLEQMCRRVEHVGPVGAGARLKLAINLPLLVYWQALAEALLLCKSLGLDSTRMMGILAETSGGPNLLKVRANAIAAALDGKDTGEVTFDVDSVRKDLQTMIEEGHALGATLPLTERTLACFDEASQDGLGDKDAVLLPTRWLQRGGR
jgi:3-hydroxyisobutyrate dehydrogenase